MAEPFNRFLSPGGLQTELIGSPLASGVIITPDRAVHEVTGTEAIETIISPYSDFVGPLILLAQGEWSWNADGNIASASGGNTIAGLAYIFIYSQARGLWYPILPSVT